MNTKTVNIITWILQGLMSIAFLMAGGLKVSTPYEQYVEMMPWAEGFSAGFIKFIGVMEITGVIGMNLPLIIKKFRIFSPLAAIGLAIPMIGSLPVHMDRGESVVMQLAFLIILIFIAVIRFKSLRDE